MPDGSDRAKRNTQKIDGLLKLIVQEGANGPGRLPPVDYLEALHDVQDVGDVHAILSAHRNERPPE